MEISTQNLKGIVKHTKAVDFPREKLGKLRDEHINKLDLISTQVESILGCINKPTEDNLTRARQIAQNLTDSIPKTQADIFNKTAKISDNILCHQQGVYSVVDGVSTDLTSTAIKERENENVSLKKTYISPPRGIEPIFTTADKSKQKPHNMPPVWKKYLLLYSLTKQLLDYRQTIRQLSGEMKQIKGKTKTKRELKKQAKQQQIRSIIERVAETEGRLLKVLSEIEHHLFLRVDLKKHKSQ